MTFDFQDTEDTAGVEWPVSVDALLNYVPDYPEFCACGRRLEIHVEEGRHNRRTGERETTTYRECPRFKRSWRNLWWGGVMHDSLFGTIGGREWR